MNSNRFSLKVLSTALALGTLLASTAAAAGLTNRIGKVTGTALLTNFTTTTKVVNGKTVYVEDVPLMSVTLTVGTANYYYQVPYSGDKAKGWLDMLTQAEHAGATVSLHHNDDYKASGRYQCANYIAEGCIEIIGPIKSPLIQWLTVSK